jgi:hypothetical protein
MNREGIVERIRRLLALADTDRNPNANEAENAARVASKLMLENKVEMAEVKQSEMDDYLILGHKVGEKNIPAWRRRLLHVIAHYNFCEIVIFRGAHARHVFGGTIFLVGLREDALAVKLIHDHVLNQINTLRDRAMKHMAAKQQRAVRLAGYQLINGMWQMTMSATDVPEVPYGPKLREWKDQFNLGMVDGICQVLEGQRREVELDEHTLAIVRCADEKTKEHIKNTFGDIEEKKEPPVEVKDLNAYVSGRVASEMVDIGTGESKPVRGRYLGEGSGREEGPD